MRYHKDMSIKEILFKDNRNIEIFRRYGLPCSTCLGAEKETLEIACRVNNLDLDAIIDELNNMENACI